MVEADPDVPHAFAHVVDELLQREPRPSTPKRCVGALRAEGRAVARAARRVEAQQAAVLRIEVEEQAVARLRASVPARGQSRAKRSTA